MSRDLLRCPSDALPVPPATDRATWSALDGPTLADIRERTNVSLGTPWPVPLQSDYSRRWRDGDP